MQFSSAISNELTDWQGMFYFNHAYAFYKCNNIMKNVEMLMKN